MEEDGAYNSSTTVPITSNVLDNTAEKSEYSTDTDQKEKAASKKYCTPIEGADISLWDEDGYWLGDEDDLLANSTSNEKGHFSVNGSEMEVGGSTFYVLAKTMCGQEIISAKSNTKKWQNTTCKRVSKIYIDSKFNGRTYNFAAQPPFYAWIISSDELGENDHLEDENGKKCE
uniref:BEACH domain-containing protein n=1 Tax=Acrobeloides nanus TaxID=290746 RepID=A0A914EA65_9BILA